MKISEVVNPKAQKLLQKNGQLSPIGTTTSEPKDAAKEKVELLVKKK